MKHYVIAALLATCWVFGSVGSVATQTVKTPVAAANGPWGVIEDYCFGCHNSRTKAGGRAFDMLSPDGIVH
ncbi:MAG TPA: hypothetical protein VFY29_16760, partial [Terriglobia bacterium]|nr:hypothetical protein [Terriglobia bacterium]